MLHLVIICIVCAAFAPSDSTAFNGQKKNESNIFYNFEGGGQNIAKVSFPSVYNVVGRNSSDFAKPGITFFYDYFIKQYQNSKSNSCSIMERVPLGEDKDLHSNADFVYRKRNLLWTIDGKRLQPKSLKAPPSSRCSCTNRRPVGKANAVNPERKKKQKKQGSPYSKLDFKSRWKKRKGRKKTGKADKVSVIKADSKKLEKCTLSPKDKKMFLCVKRCRGQKNNNQKASLDSLQVDDDLDLNKRIKKLVEELAVENQRKKEHSEERITGEGKESEISQKNLKNEDILSPILNNIKQMFTFSKNDRIVGNTKTDPVSSMRDRYNNPGKAENTVSSYDVLGTLRKTVRLRRNPPKIANSNECSKNRGPKYKNILTGWPNPYSANFKANVNFLYPQRSRKFFPENAKKRRWMKLRMRRNMQKKGLRHWPILKRTFEKFHGSDTKPAYGDRSSDSNRKPAAANKTHRSYVNATGTSQGFLKGETMNCMSEGRKNSESPYKIVTSNSRVNERGESTTENVIVSTQPSFPFNTMEKPLLEKQQREEKLKVIKDMDRFVTEGPTTRPVHAHNLFGGIKNHINPLRYLKFRHTLRGNIDRNKVEDAKKLNVLYGRKKRNEWKLSSSAANKDWRSAPVLCTSYIRSGQEDQIKYLIKLIQTMMGKPVPLKWDFFEQTKYKSSCGKRSNTPGDFGEEGDPNHPSSLSYLCNSPHLHSKFFQLFPHSRVAANPKVHYESVKVEGLHDNRLHASSTLNPTDTLPRTTVSVQLHKPQNVNPKSVLKSAPASVPVTERSGKINGSSQEKVASSESSPLSSNKPVTHSRQLSSVTSPVPTFSSSAKAQVALHSKIPAPTAFPSNASTRCTTCAPVSTTTTNYKVPCETNSPTRSVSELSTASASGKQTRTSTVNSYVLQQSESHNENGVTSATSSCKGEVCTKMINHFSEAPSEEPQIQKVDEQVSSKVHTRDVCRAVQDNPTAVRFELQPNSESVDSQYPAPETNARFKDTELYNSNHLSRVGRSKNEETRRKVGKIQKLSGSDGREAAFRAKRFHHFKKCKSKSNHNKKCGCVMSYLRKQYNRLLEKTRTYREKTKSKAVAHQNKSTTPSGEHNCPTEENTTECDCQHQNTDVPVITTPVYVNTDHLPIYDPQTQKIIQQSPDNSKQLKSKNQLPVLGAYQLHAGPYTYVLNPPLERNKNYLRMFTTTPPSMSYGKSQQHRFYLKRQKRSDEYYVWPENEYGDYFYDAKDQEEDPGSLPSLESSPFEAWTPPSYDMFRELAKAVTETQKHEPEEKNLAKTADFARNADTAKNSETISTINPLVTSCFLPPHALPNATTTCIFFTTTTTVPISTTNVLLQSSTELTTTEEPSTTAAATTVADLPSPPPSPPASPPPPPPSSVSPPPTSPSTSPPATITTSITSTLPSSFTGRIRNKPKGGKKSYERFSKHSGISKNLVDSRDDKERQIEELVPAEDMHSPTTLKPAVLVRGQKKFQGKPSPKVYMKVFPDSFEKNESGGGEALITTTRAAEIVSFVKATEQGPVSMKTDLRLQILAVCEGYLEVVKLIKAQNQTLAEETDENLARYCENIISQHFNFQSEKPKKFDSNELLAPPTNRKESEKEPDPNDGPELYEDFISPYEPKILPNEHFRDVSASDNFGELTSKRKNDRHLTSQRRSHVRRRKKRRNLHRSSRQFPKLRRARKKKDAEEDLEGKETGKEQKQLIRLLRKRKKALLSWLLTANDGIKPDELQETEYFDGEDLIDPESDTAQYSGTIKPRRDEKGYRTTQKNKTRSRETLYPVYAKDYGYESGGELIEVEVLWRQVNEKTHENKIFKNLSVLALFLTSTPSPKLKPEETKLVGDDSEIETETKWKKNKLVFDAAKTEAETDNSNLSSTNIKECTKNSTSHSGAALKKFAKVSHRTIPKNQTHTIISKPDPTSIVGAPTCANNKTQRKISHKYGVAKDIFQEYSIEFLNYAVYILPVMFTVLFLLCCLCCALQILKIQKSRKKRKKKKKKVTSSEDTSVSVTSETESKKRKRETKRKRNSGSKENYDSVHKKKSKTFWNCLKVYSKPSREMDEDNDQTEKKKSFLGFLKSRRDDGKPGYSSAPTAETDDEAHTSQCRRERKHYSDQHLTSRRAHEKHRKEEQGEAAERRELIALLEELKKIETEHIEAKKEVKSVQVQYAFPEYDNPLFQPKSQIPDFAYPYEKNVFGMPKGVYPFYNKKFPFHPTVPPSSRDYDLYEEVNELTKLLPWECYPQRNDFLKHYDFKIDQNGRCDRFLKILRDSGMNFNGAVVEKKYTTNESESRSFIFNKYRSMNVEKSEELRGVSGKMSGAEVRLMENVSPCKLSSNRDEDLAEDADNLKCQLNKKKYVRLKDEGVLCRL